VGVVPGEARPRAEALRQLGYALLREPGFRGCAALPQVDATGAGVAIEVVLSDQALVTEVPVDRSRGRAALDGIILAALRQVELDDNNAVTQSSVKYSEVVD
jgi:hypothetical protein